MSEEIYTGLDVGSYAVRVAVGKLVPTAESKDQMHIIGAVEVQSSGINKGTITNLEDAVSSVSRALEQAVTQRDGQSVRTVTHRMRSAITNLGGSKAAAVVAEIEHLTQCPTGEGIPWVLISSKARQLGTQTKSLLEQLTAWSQQDGPL